MLNARFTVFLLEIIKRRRFVLSKLSIWSFLSTIYLTALLEMRRINSVKGQASCTRRALLVYSEI